MVNYAMIDQEFRVKYQSPEMELLIPTPCCFPPRNLPGQVRVTGAVLGYRALFSAAGRDPLVRFSQLPIQQDWLLPLYCT